MAAAPATPDLSGQSALVTGGSRGIGLAIAEALLAAGAGVVITGRDQSHLDAARTRLGGADRALADRLHVLRADVRNSGAAAAAVAAAVERFGGLDVLINNAGVGIFGNVAEMDESSWNDVIATNLTGVFSFCRAAIPPLRTRGGWIINISSLAGQNPFAGGAAYCASKAGLNAFTEALMHEVRHDNIRVSCILPGSVATSFSRGTSPGGPPADWKLAPEDVARAVLDLLGYPARSLPSRLELRPSRPARR
jgi:3-oxoacyl-[acyl-carrier protein] reductase